MLADPRSWDKTREDMMADPTGAGGGPAKQAAEGPNPIPDHPLAARIQKNPGEHQTSIILTGYQRASTQAGKIRIYLGTDFQSYYELPLGDILHHWMSDTDDPNSPTIFSIKAAATPDLVIPSLPSAAAQFLDGPIVSSILANAIEAVSSMKRAPDKTGPPPTCNAGTQRPVPGGTPRSFRCLIR
jgi:hypothetical protein